MYRRAKSASRVSPARQTRRRSSTLWKLAVELLETRCTPSSMGLSAGLQLGASGAEHGVRVKADAQGNEYVMGLFAGTVDFDPGAGVTNASSSDGEGFLAKYNAQQELQWVRTFGPTSGTLTPSA